MEREMNLTKAHDTLLRLFPTRLAVELRGPVGVGKSSVVEQVCADLSKMLEQDVGMVVVMLSTYDQPDVRGFQIPQKNDRGEMIAVFTRPEWFPQPHNVVLFRGGQRLGYVRDIPGAQVPTYGVIFADELGQASDDVKKPFAEVLLNKRIGSFDLPKGWTVWAASNRMKDRSGVLREMAFSQNRKLLLNIDGDVETWVRWAERSGIHPLTIAFVKKNPGSVFKDEVPEQEGPFCTPRSIVNMTISLMALNETIHELANDTVALDVASGWVGQGVGSTYMAFIKLADEIPEIEDIIRDPSGTRLPDRPDVQFVLAQMLAHFMSHKTAGALLTYAMRMPQEMQILTVRAANRRDPTLLQVKEMAEYAMRNQRLILAASG
jgi:rRNA processing protein Gar1